MIKGYAREEMGKLALGTHLGDFSSEVSEQYVQAIMYGLKNGIRTIDGAINYRGMCSEKDEGAAISSLLNKGELKREDLFITSKAGLLFGDVQAGLNPRRYLSEVLAPIGITEADFIEYEGLLQTLNPVFYEHALNKSLNNLGLETLDAYYIHIPEISKSGMTEEEFYQKMELLFAWCEEKVKENKIRKYGVALEFMVEEPEENKWHLEIEKLKKAADQAAEGLSHFKYVLYEYNLLCQSARTVSNHHYEGQVLSLYELCRELGLETVGSMPFAMGDAFEKYSIEELLRFALEGVDHVIVGSKNTSHIQEIIDMIGQ